MKLTNTYQEPNRCQKRTISYWKVDKESAAYGVQGVSVQCKVWQPAPVIMGV